MSLKRALLGALAVASVGAAAGGCRGGKPQAPSADDPQAISAVRSYIGQARLIRHEPGAREVSVRKGAARGGQCVTAVMVQSASLTGGTARLALQVIGRPSAKQGARCRELPPGLRLAVSDFGAAAAAEDVQAGLDAVLLSPEAYLQTSGLTFAYAPVAAEATIAHPEGTPDERNRARKVTSWPKPVLAIDPYYHDPTGRVRHEGEAEFEAVVGSDGRVQRPRVKTALGENYEKAVVQALSLWRYEPARQGDKPIAAHIDSRLVFRIY